MKMLFVYSQIEKNLQATGEAKKIEMQKNAVIHNGVEAEIIYHKCKTRFFKLYMRMPVLPIYSNHFVRGLMAKLKRDNYDTLFIRKHIMDYSFYNMLKTIRKELPQIKIVLEIPTYPYDLEWASLVDLPYILKEKPYRNKLHNYVDYIVTYSNDDEIFGIKCIKIKNGIDPDSIPAKGIRPYVEKDIQLLGVAGIEKWHGFDRIILGLKEYYEKHLDWYNITFHVVGDGGELNNLKKMVSQYHLEKNVIFHGIMFGKELDKMFDLCDIGVGSLGMNRIGMQEGYTLKLKEYSARGIPFVYAYDDKLIELGDTKFYRKYPNDETPIPMESIIDFHKQNIENGYLSLVNEMREFAYDKLTWKEQMKTVVDTLRKDELE